MSKGSSLVLLVFLILVFPVWMLAQQSAGRPLFTPGEIWSMEVFGAGTVFAAGMIVEKVRNKRYVTKEMCSQIHKLEAARWEQICQDLKYLRNKFDALASIETPADRRRMDRDRT
jgi:hypothetical protein